MRRGFYFSLLPILAAPFILLAPVYLRGQALFWGTPLLQFIPWWHYTWDVLSAGHLPLWNPYLGMGAPPFNSTADPLSPTVEVFNRALIGG